MLVNFCQTQCHIPANTFLEVRISPEELKGTDEILAGLTELGGETLYFVIQIWNKNA
jgi:hypothetical protein